MITEESYKENEVEMNSIQFKRLDEEAKLPSYAHPSDAGMDLSVVKDVELQPKEERLVRTGLAAKIPPQYYRQIKMRSSKALAGLRVFEGVIDEKYHSEIKLILKNRNPINVAKIFAGDKIV